MFIGPSSSGKDFFFNRVFEKYELNRIVLATTRPKRVGEVEGVTYYFKTNSELNKLEEEQKLVERRDYNTVHGIWSYATIGDTIDESKNYIVINTWKGYEKYLEYFGLNQVIPFYFDLDINIRFERAFMREKRQEEKRYLEMCRRFIADEEDFKKEWLDKYSPIIINNNGSIENTDQQLDDNIKRLIK